MIQKRGNLRWRSSERFNLEDLSGILGVPKGKLISWLNLKLRATEPALTEVNALSDYVVSVAPIKIGRRMTHVELRWWAKDANSTASAERELQFSKVGRKQRTHVETVPTRPGWLEARGHALRSETYETAPLRHPGFDIYHVEGGWREWSKDRAPTTDPDKAFLAFCRTFAERNPV